MGGAFGALCLLRGTLGSGFGTLDIGFLGRLRSIFRLSARFVRRLRYASPAFLASLASFIALSTCPIWASAGTPYANGRITAIFPKSFFMNFLLESAPGRLFLAYACQPMPGRKISQARGGRWCIPAKNACDAAMRLQLAERRGSMQFG